LVFVNEKWCTTFPHNNATTMVVDWIRPVNCHAIFLLFHVILAAASSDVPIKVFILAGQSNMVGKGAIRHLDRLVQANGSEYREMLWNRTQYKVRKDVYVKFLDQHGFLTVSRTAGLAAPRSFGPEVMMGISMGDALRNASTHSRPAAAAEDESPAVLLIKVAYGSRSLAVDFRPPSAGIGNYADTTNASLYGWQYRIMMDDIDSALHNMTAYVPGYNQTAGYELCGFIWLQGWNDVLEWATVKEYESNLVHFIGDVRSALQAPDLPFGTN
jgi:Carbohydrate esterase, sialic acid-specific acetylesterase